MNTLWTIWLLGIVASFAVFEGIALETGRTTLSRYIWTFSKAWPPLPWFAGFVTGFLVCHFFWGGIVCFAPVN